MLYRPFILLIVTSNALSMVYCEISEVAIFFRGVFRENQRFLEWHILNYFEIKTPK